LPETPPARRLAAAGRSPGGISVDGAKAEEIVHARDVQIYLDEARVGGQIHYSIERPSYPPESRYYTADLDIWMPFPVGHQEISTSTHRIVYLIVGFFVLFSPR